MTAASLVLLAFLAQATPSSATPEAKAKAQSLLKEGTKLYERGNPAEALEKFNQAYAAYPSPKLFFNIGQTNRDLGRPAEAMDAFERFLDEAKDATADLTAEAKKSIAELKAKLGSLQIGCATPGAEIGVDGKPIGLSPLANSLWVTPGVHQVTAKDSNAALAIETVNVQAGAVQTVILRLHPAPGPVAATSGPAPAPAIDVQSSSAHPVASSESDHGWWLGRKWTWVAAGSAVVLTGTAAFFGARMQSKFDSLNGSCGSASQSTVACSRSDIDSAKSLKNTANVFWGLAGAAAVTAGVLFFVEARPVSVIPVAGESTGFLATVRY